MKQTYPARRDVLKAIGLGITSFAIQGCTRAGEKPSRPNIIFLLTDDQRAGTLSGSGHPVIRTPNLDKLISGGIQFTRAFVAEPTCAPSRTTMLTGQYERVHGIGFSSTEKLTDKQWESTYPALLQRAGYHTGFIGKFGVEYYTFRGSADQKYDFWRGHDGWARFFAKTVDNCDIYRDSEEDIVTPIMGESIERFLNSLPEGKPFCLSVSFSAPHGSISGSMLPDETASERMTHPANSHPLLKDHPIYGSLYRDKDVKIPDATATDPGKYIPAEVLNQSGGRTQCYSYDYSRKTCLEHHHRYYQLITGIDKAVGQLSAGLKKRGLSDNTVIIFTSDHGLLMGEYGMGGKALLYDLTTRVPLIIYDPKLPKEKQSRRIEELVITTDIAPTILSYAGIKIPETMQGKNLTKLINNPEMDWRDEIFLENLYTGRDNPLIEGVRTKQWKYVRYFKAGNPYTEKDLDFRDREPVFEQLFNLDNDPAEVNNLVKDSKYAEILNVLKKRCKSYSAEMMNLRKKYRQKTE